MFPALAQSRCNLQPPSAGLLPTDAKFDGLPKASTAGLQISKSSRTG